MPTPIQIQATKLEIPYSLSQLDNKKNEIAALVESLGLTFEGEQNLYDTLIALGIEQVKAGEQYDSIDLTKGAAAAPVTLKVTERPKVGLSVDTASGTAIVAVESKPTLAISIQESNEVDVQTKEKLSISVINPNTYSYKPNFDSSPALFAGDEYGEGLTDELKAVRDGLGNESKLRLSKSKTEIQDSAIVRSSTNPTMRLIADNPDNPTTGEDMGTLRFTRNFEDPLALDLARAIFADFTERVTADGGTIEGTEECVASELELIVSGEYLINMVDIRPEYTGTLGSTKADLVFYLNDGAGSPQEKFRVTQEGNIEVKDSLSGVVIRSRNDTPYRILVDNDGRLEATALDAAAPVINGVPTISGLAAITETLTATKASVTSSPALTTTYQWQVSDNGTTGWGNISGATSSTYLIPLEYANKFLRVQQIETNILGQTTAFSASTTAVIPSLLVSAMIQRLGNFENETYVYDSLVDFDAIELS